LIAQSYSISPFDLPIVITRFANIYGPGQINFSALIPDLIRSALKLSVFDPRSDGTLIRDYLFVEEVVNLYLLISENQFINPSDHNGQIYNAGSNNFYDVKTIIEKIFNKLNNNQDFLTIIDKMNNKITEGEIINQSMDYKKVFNIFGWSPQIDIDEGLDKTIAWYKEYFKKYS
jgi:CDP-glucose 4,6-dehydratase